MNLNLNLESVPQSLHMAGMHHANYLDKDRGGVGGWMGKRKQERSTNEKVFI